MFKSRGKMNCGARQDQARAGEAGPEKIISVEKMRCSSWGRKVQSDALGSLQEGGQDTPTDAHQEEE